MGCLAHTQSLDSLQDKYLADMDELFSQVDEKRRVSTGLWDLWVVGAGPVSPFAPDLTLCAAEARHP